MTSRPSAPLKKLEKDVVRAHRLAERIMVINAKAQAEASDRRSVDWGYFYDPLAATCLGNLIYETMCAQHKPSGK